MKKILLSGVLGAVLMSGAANATICFNIDPMKIYRNFAEGNFEVREDNVQDYQALLNKADGRLIYYNYGNPVISNWNGKERLQFCTRKFQNLEEGPLEYLILFTTKNDDDAPNTVVLTSSDGIASTSQRVRYVMGVGTSEPLEDGLVRVTFNLDKDSNKSLNEAIARTWA